MCALLVFFFVSPEKSYKNKKVYDHLAMFKYDLYLFRHYFIIL